ncbi:MAG: ABC transporter ATP-binding protein [Mycobacteriales bacterium]
MKLELRGITKRFGPLLACDHVDLVVEPGQVHALLGENGAGKSTLMNVLYGLTAPDEGEIVVDGSPRRFRGPNDAIAAGIGMVHQHFMLIPVFTVAENVLLGRERTKAAGFLDRRRARADVRDLSVRYGLEVDPDARVEDLPVGVQQRVEIVKALVRDADVLILDEPTAVLTPQEIDGLLAVMRSLREAGKSIVFITHKLTEVKAIADTITVIRRGRVVGEVTSDASEADLASLMVGRSVLLRVDKALADPGEVVLDVSHLCAVDAAGARALDDVSFDVRAGEILAVAGVQGNGQTELAQILLGLGAPTAGQVTLDGRPMAGRSPKQILRAGVGYVPEDRQHDGLVSSFSVADNLVLDQYDEPPFASGITFRPGPVRDNAARLVEEFDVRAGSVGGTVGTLSGGNQQEVVLARELSRTLRLMVVSQPTRGVDVGSTEAIHRRIVAARDAGVAVLMVSSELDEVMSLADRIAVMYCGGIVGILGPDATRDELGLMMAGVAEDEAITRSESHPTELSQIQPAPLQDARTQDDG